MPIGSIFLYFVFRYDWAWNIKQEIIVVTIRCGDRVFRNMEANLEKTLLRAVWHLD
jgi:hypothetical protein